MDRGERTADNDREHRQTSELICFKLTDIKKRTWLVFLSRIEPCCDDVTVCSYIITQLFVVSLGRRAAGCQSLMTSSVAAASLTCHRLSVTPAVTSACHHQSVQRSVLSVSSVSACMLLWFQPLMFCGLSFTDADWK